MIPEEALYSILSTDAGVIALVSTRIYPGKLPQSVTFPAVAVRSISAEHEEVLDGPLGLRYQRIRVFSTASESTGGYKKTKQVANAIRLALTGYQGQVNDLTTSPVGVVRIFGIFALTTFDDYDDKTNTFQDISDFSLVTAEEV